MCIFCTYCSASKIHDPGLVPAIRRYRSERIDRVYAAACALDVPFFVLSGKFGLVAHDLGIPDYDHKLAPQEVPAVAEQVASQIQQEGISGLVYFTKPLSSSVGLLPYRDTAAAGCSKARCAFFVVELEGEAMSSWKEIMSEADDAKLRMVSDRTAGERMFGILLQQNPRDGMIYFKRGEGYEAIGERALAASDFQKAMVMFPREDWKKRAKSALERVS